MKNLAIARRYAKALLLIGKDDGQIDTYRKELGAFANLIEQEKSLDEARVERDRVLRALQIAQRQSLEETEISAQEEVERARLASDREIEEVRILKERDVQRLEIERSQALELAEIERVLRDFGEERFARRIARAIVQARAQREDADQV